MLRLNKLTDYGIVLLTYMAGPPETSMHSARELAAGTGLPLATVGKILRELLDHNLVVSRRGTKGGYTLARPAGNISVAEIIAAMEGPIGFTECYTAPGCCDLEPSCTVRYNSGVIGRALHRALENIRLSDLTRPLHLAHMASGRNVVSITLGPGRTQ
ncbi:MAG: SUF system Fe-S cluster assembly regulator [Acidobacteria bacterium]|nr:SUF system Fe-S cluster assembly regulator [Acidobacteriota bacterium]